MSERIATTARLYVRPRMLDGQPLMVRKPVGGHLSPAGEAVNDETYWQRRLADGDVEAMESPDAPKALGKTGK